MLGELKIDVGKCTKCKRCLDVCFENVIEWDEENQKPYGKYALDCQICCLCETVCPSKALIVIPDWSKKYYPKPISKWRNER